MSKEENYPWTKQPGESRKAFEAFCVYRDMDGKRSYVKASAQLSKSVQLITRWGWQWHWQDRLDAYTIYQDTLKREMQEKAKRDMAERHAREAQLMHQKIIERLRTINAQDLTPSDVAKWFDIAVKVERLSLGEPTENVNQSGQVRQNHEINGSGDLFERIDKYTKVFEESSKRGETEGGIPSNDT